MVQTSSVKGLSRRARAAIEVLQGEHPGLEPAAVRLLEQLARRLSRSCEGLELLARLRHALESPEFALLGESADTSWMSPRVRKRYHAELLRLIELPVSDREDYLAAHESWKGPIGLFYDTAETRQAFAVLGLEPPGTPDQIRQAYRREARRLHPDFGGASEPFILLQRAYRTALESCI